MNQLRELRKETGLTQIEAASLLGVSRRTYQTYESSDNSETDPATFLYEKIIGLLEENKKHHILSIKSIKLKCSPIFRKYPEVECAFLYGSYARQEATYESDVDLLVVCHNMGLDFFEMARELEEILGKEVDLQTQEQLTGRDCFTDNFLIEGVRIYEKRKRYSKNWYVVETY